MRDLSVFDKEDVDGLRAVAAAARAVAGEVLDKTLVPGVGKAFRHAPIGKEGIVPWCAFGHVMARVGFAPTEPKSGNLDILMTFMGRHIEYEDQRTPFNITGLTADVSGITQCNDGDRTVVMLNARLLDFANDAEKAAKLL
jgi:hypothetical protein